LTGAARVNDDRPMLCRTTALAAFVLVACSGIARAEQEAPLSTPIQSMSWSDAETFLRARGCTLHPELDPDKPEQLNGRCRSGWNEWMFIFAKPHDARPAQCILVYWNDWKTQGATPDWRAAIKLFTGADASHVPDPGRKEKAYRLKSPTGPVTIGMGGDVTSFSVGTRCN
jgi:hypothetical protein